MFIENIKLWFESIWEQLVTGNLWNECVIALLAITILLNVPYGKWVAVVALVYAVWQIVNKMP